MSAAGLSVSIDMLALVPVTFDGLLVFLRVEYTVVTILALILWSPS